MLLAAGCRSSDPYADLKPGQLLDEGQRLLRMGDLPGAEKALRLGLRRAEKNGLNVEKARRAFLSPLFHLAVKRGDGKEAERILGQMGEAADARATHDVVVLTQRAGMPDEARAKAEMLASVLHAHAASDDDERAVRVAAWITIDRLRSARFDPAAARDASEEVVAALADVAEFRGSFRPMPPGLRGWVSRYIDHLFATDRPDAAKAVATLIERIDENAPPPETDALCLPLYAQWQNLGCLLEIGR